MSDASIAITYFAVLFGLGVIVANYFKKRHIPDSIFLIFLGLILGPTVLGNPAIAQYIKIDAIDIGAMGPIPDFLRTFALIMIVFAGMFSLGLQAFKKNSDTSIKFAVLGVVFNTILLGVAAHFIFGLDWVFAFLLGGVISGTADAIIFTFDSILDRDYRRVMNVLKAEAIFNSPICILIPLVFLDLVTLQAGALIEPMAYFSKFVLMMVAGLGTGILLGLGFSKFVTRMTEDFIVLFMIAISLLTYATSEYVGGSGILAVAICGLIVGDMGFKEKDYAKKFDNHFSEMLRIAVFMFLGAQVTLAFGLSDIIPILLFFTAIVLARPLFVILVLGKEGKSYTKQEKFVMSFMGARGIDSAAMMPIVAGVLVAAGQGAAAASMMNMVVIVIILTVVFSTLMAKYAASKGFAGSQLSAKNYSNRETLEEVEDDLEGEIEHQDEKPEASPEVQTKSAEDESPAKDPRTNRRKGKSRKNSS